ncbi:MAG: tetratricopeptide repeat protein [Kiritimatiellales bacterium]|nr:tetratricopeptide repeat protein [Kiritimatiellota bacterium]MBL7011972.1 tetratricopeptide repeat protein [Kiritimatiellales bacterium]
MKLETGNLKFEIGLLVLIALVSGCASTKTADAVVEPKAGSALSRTELELWNTKRFKKQFAESYIAVTDVEPRVTTIERDELMKVQDLIGSDKMDEAARLLEKSRGEAVSATFDFMLGNIYLQTEQLEKAVAAYETAVEKYPKFRRAHRNLGLIYVQQGEFEKALPALTKSVELGDTESLTYGLLGFAYSSIENNLSAESAYRQAVLLDPATMDWKMGLARALFKQQCYPEAVALCAALIDEDPARADLWLLQANAYVGLKEPLKAAENYELVDQLGQSTVDSLNMLGDIYVNEGLYEMAVDAYIRAMEQNPDRNAERPIRAAKVLVTRGALRETKALIQHVEDLHGAGLGPVDKKDLLKLQARIAVAEGQGEEEVRVLEQIVELDPLDGEALILLGQHAGRANEPEKAIFYYERAESLEKYEADAKVRHAQLLVSQSKYTEALPLLRRAQEIKPRDDIQKYLDQVERVAKSR